jgi:16S rRNA (guanine1516-N2)-methyltransferase
MDKSNIALNKKSVAITTPDNELIDSAKSLATQWILPYVDFLESDYQYLLVLTKEHLQLQQQNSNLGPLYIDFVKGKLPYRQKHGGGFKEPLVKAVGVKGSHYPSVIDTTAGLGNDSYILASLGCKVTMIERNNVCAALLADALVRAQSETMLELALVHADAIDYLQKLKNKPDVIYLDPMFPEKKNSAAVKKGMQYLQRLIGSDLDSHKLLDIALATASKRVVVKRPSYAEAVGKIPPSMSIKSVKHRFDVYLLGHQ